MKLNTNIRTRSKRLDKKLKLGSYQEIYLYLEASILNQPPEYSDKVIDFYIDLTDKICEVVEKHQGHCSISCSKGALSGGVVALIGTDINKLVSQLRELKELAEIMVYKPVDANYSSVWGSDSSFELIKSKGLLD
ncbi:hypothetical protein VCHA53O466_40200 [Vibrio chagasii]|nr:hypothetical protein VCHA53O466_40200 [Vibrio chagasii]